MSNKHSFVHQDGGGSDSEDEQEQLNELEQALKMHDPTFKTELETEVKSREDDREVNKYMTHCCLFY